MAARRSEEARAVDDVGTALEDRLQQQGVLARVVLEVGVLDDDDVARGFADAARDGGALALVRGWSRTRTPSRPSSSARMSRVPSVDPSSTSRFLSRCLGDRRRGRARRSREWWPARCSRASDDRKHQGRLVVSITPGLGPCSALPPFDSADKAAVCSRFSSRSRRRAREKADREEKRRRTPTPLLARRSALSRRRQIRERPGTDPRFRVPGVAPALAAPRGPRWADRGVARCVAPSTPARSARRAAAARRSGDTPGHRVRTFAASTRPTDRHPPGGLGATRVPVGLDPSRGFSG